MPELPDITVYTERLQALAGGQVLKRLRLLSPFVLRTALPPVSAIEGRVLRGVQRLGKRVVLVLGALADTGSAGAAASAVPAHPAAVAEGEDLHFAVIHLMVAGRLLWKPPGAKPPGRITLACFEFETGTLVFTEAGTRRQASLHLLADRAALAALEPGGAELADLDLAAFTSLLRAGNHTLKRALTDPHLFSGIGNAYSDEILHRARLSPLALTRSLGDAEALRLFEACHAVMAEWTDRLRNQALANTGGHGWPEKVTAFRPEMAVHGRYGQPCPDCGAPVQRILRADNEVNYCAPCQTGGKLLADRGLSRLLKDDWPKRLEGF